MWSYTVTDRDRQRVVHDLEILAQSDPRPAPEGRAFWNLPRLRRHVVRAV
ncbi:MAG: hypothetical protein WAV45_12265 [Propionibacteriaceae bacterium]|nr:hypothetical protein [Micropruina sp.]